MKVSFSDAHPSWGGSVTLTEQGSALRNVIGVSSRRFVFVFILCTDFGQNPSLLFICILLCFQQESKFARASDIGWPTNCSDGIH